MSRSAGRSRRGHHGGRPDVLHVVRQRSRRWCRQWEWASSVQSSRAGSLAGRSYQVVGEAEVAGERDGQAEEERCDPGDQDGGFRRRGGRGGSKIMLIRWQSSTSPGQGVVA